MISKEDNEHAAEEIVERLIRAVPQDGEFALSDATIRGRLELKYQIVPVAVILTNCTFTDDVDIGYSEFKQYVDFSGSCFEKDFKSAKTIYRKDICCYGAVFKGGVILSSVQCDGSGYFDGVQFGNQDKEVSFLYARFGELSFGEFQFVVDPKCQEYLDKKTVNDDLQRQFENIDISLPEDAIVEIERQDRMWRISDGNGKHICTIVKESKGSGELMISPYPATIFEGGVAFNDLQCKGSGFFRNTRFNNEERCVDFTTARFNLLVCTCTVFKGSASFNSLICEGGGFFKYARFEGKSEIDFSYAKFGLSLEFQSAMFAGEVSLGYSEVSGILILWKTDFLSRVSLNCATIHTLSLMNQRDDYGSKCYPFGKEKSKVDLRRCRFEIFEGTEEQQRHMLDAQSPDKFSQDPYLQFEQYYRSIGDEAYAKKIYHDARVALRKNYLRRYCFWNREKRQQRNPEIRWSIWKVISDWVLRRMVGYGVKMWVPFLWILSLLIVGTGAFWSDEALKTKNSGLVSIGKPLLRDLGMLGPANLDQGNGGYEFLQHLGHRFWYSLDLFIPIVNLRVVEEYSRPQGWRALYAVFHISMGWLLVPLVIASLSGVIRK